MELGIPATRRAPGLGGVDTAQVFEEGRDTCVDAHRPGESRDAAAQAPEARVDLQARLKYLCDARAAGTKSVEDLLDGVGHLIRF